MASPHEPLVPPLETTLDDANSGSAPHPHRSILPLYALSLLLLATAVAGFIWYDLRWAYSDTLAHWDVRMSTSANERVSFADLWLSERQTDTEGIAGSALAVRLLSMQANGSNLAETQKEVEHLIERMARINGFLGGAVADTECRIAAQTGLPAEAATGVRETCNRAQRTGDFQVFVAGVQRGHVFVYLACPVFAAGEASLQRQVSRHALGAAVMIAEPWERTFPFMSSESEPQRTTQTLLVWEDLGKAVVFSPRLGMEGVESVFRRSLSEPTMESRVAREGKVDFGEYTDYRGVRVFAVARPLGPAQASLVRKVNRDEALSEFRRRAVLEWLAGILSTLLLGAVIVIQERHLTTRELKEKLRQQRVLLHLKRHVEASEERFRELVESVDAIVWEADAATLRPTFVSQGAERILGFSPAQWLQTPNFWADHLHPEDRERGLACERETLGKGKALSVEYRMEKVNGQFRWFQDFMHLVRGAEGEAKLLRGIMVDVTESKEAELALNASEERYRAFLANSSEGIWRAELEPPISIALPVEEQVGKMFQFGYLAECNDVVARQYGFERAEEIIGRRGRDLISRDPHNIDNLRAFVRSGYRLEDAEVSGKDRQGKVRHFLNTYYGVIEDGHLVRAWGVRRDITERKKVEEALRHSEDKYRSIVMNIPDIVWTIDSQGRIVFVSPNVDKLSNVNAQELYQGGLDFFFNTVHPDDVQPMKELLQTAFVDRQPHETEYRARHTNRIWRIRTVGAFEKDGGLYLQGLMTDITERKRAEEGLAKLAAIVESSNDAIVGITPDGTVTSWNPGAEILFGYRPEEMIGKPVSILTPAGLGDETRRMLETIRHGERIPSSETVRVARGGQSLHVSLSVAPLKNARGEVVGGAGIARDITERHNFVSQLRLQTAALQAAHNGIVITGRDGKIIWANAGFSTLTGYQKEEVIGENPRFLRSGKQSPAFYDELWGTILQGNVWHGELTNRRKDGSFYEEEMTITPVRDEAGAITHFIAIKQDVTQRKQTEEALRESEQFNREVIASAQEGVIVYDREFRYLVWNRFMEEMTGMPAAQVLGHSAFDLFPHLREQNVEPLLRRALAGETVQAHDTSYLVPETGKSGWVSGTYSPHFGANGQIVGVVGIVREITERKQAEEALVSSETRYRTLFEAANDAVFLHGVKADGSPDTFIAVNTVATERLGFSAQEFSALTPADIDAGGLEEERRRALEAVRRKGHATFEMVHVAKDGRHIPVEISSRQFVMGDRTFILSIARDITERKQAEEEIARLKHAIDAHYDSAYWTDSQDRFIYVNEAGCRALGYSRDELTSMTLSDINPKGTPERLKQVWERLRSRGFFSAETVHRRKDGSEFPVEVVTSYVRFRGAEYACGFARDISQRKQAEEALRESEARLKAIFDSVQTGIFIIDPETHRIVDANPVALRTIGVAREQVVGAECHSFICPADKGNCPFTDLGQTIDHSERILLTANGENRTVLKTVVPVAIGSRKHLLESFIDITERKRAEEALRESEVRYRGLFESSLEGIGVSKGNQIVNANRALLDIFGYSDLEEFAAIPLREHIAPQSQGLIKEIQEKLSRGEPYPKRFEYQITRKDGETRTLEISTDAVYFGGERYTQSTFRDITERKRAEAELADRLRFETLLAELSARFVNVPAEQLDVEIEDAQRRICECLRLEACSLWQASVETPNFVTLTHLHRTLEGPPPAMRMNVHEDFPWCHRQVRAGQVVAMSSLEELPAEAARDRESWRQLGVKSALIIGLCVGAGPPVAVLSFNTIGAERTWPEEIVNRLQLVAQIFSNALARQRSDRALRESEQRFRAIFQGAAEGIVVSDFETHGLVYANPAVCRMLGYTEEELAHMSVSDLHRAEDRERVEAGYMAQTRGERTSASAIPCLRKDGAAIYADINASRLEVGGRDCCVAFFTDITARKRAEEALRESEERFRGLSNASLEGIMIHDQGLILDANMAFARLFGYERPEELIGRPGLDIIIAPESRSSIRERMQRQDMGPLELTCVRKDGTRFAAETDSRPVRYFGHSASVVACRDITERKRAKEALQRSLEQLRALAARLQNIREEERKRVAREIHDQLGQALTAIKLDLSSLARDLPAELNHLATKSSPILQLVDGAIQTVRRIATELRPGMLDDLGLVATLEWAAEVFEGRTGTKCRLDLPREEIIIDPGVATAVFRIFQETLTNVARHANASEVEVRLAKQNGDLILEVRDNGKGFAEASLSSGESLGILGMRERALLFGGEFEISSAEGEGTKVGVRIPAGRRAD